MIVGLVLAAGLFIGYWWARIHYEKQLRKAIDHHVQQENDLRRAFNRRLTQKRMEEQE